MTTVAERSQLLVLLIALAVLSTGCGHTIRSSETGGVATAPLAIPFPRHESSALTEYLLLGKDTDGRSGEAVDVGTTLKLDISVSSFEWATYRFNVGANAPDSVSVQLEQGATTAAWIAVADFNAGRWEFSGPYTKQKTLSIDDSRYISPAGNLWVAVVVDKGQTATVNALSIRTVNPSNQPPAADLQADVLNGDAPLLVHFDAAASTDSDGSIIEYAWDFDGDGLYDGFSDGPQVSHTYTAPGLYSAQLRVTDDQFTRALDTVDIGVNVAGNSLPTASLFADVTDGPAPLVVNFDASASSDPDGTIVKYEWDWESDGSYDAAGASPTATHTYSVAGPPFSATVRVTDNVGASDKTSQVISVRGWANTEDPDRNGADITSMAIVDGNPAIAYTRSGSVKFVRANDPDGVDWPVNKVQVAASTGGQYISLAVVNGNPALAYFDQTNSDLKFARANSADGANWNAPLSP